MWKQTNEAAQVAQGERRPIEHEENMRARGVLGAVELHTSDVEGSNLTTARLSASAALAAGTDTQREADPETLPRLVCADEVSVCLSVLYRHPSLVRSLLPSPHIAQSTESALCHSSCHRSIFFCTSYDRYH